MTAADPSTHFTAAIGERFANLHLLSGAVNTKGIEVEYPTVQRVPGTGAPMPLFSMLARDHPWDIGEQALSTYLLAFGLGRPWVAIPVFPSRFFPHTGLWVNRQVQGISSPADLVGRRVACGSFGTNYSVWCRGALTHQYDVPIQKMTWVESVDEHILEFKPPSRFVTERVPGSAEPVAILGLGQTDAATLPGPARDADKDKIRPMFEDPYGEIAAFAEQFGFVPANTVITIRRDAIERNPELPQLVFDSWVEAKAMYDGEIADGKADPHMGLSLSRLKQATGLTLPPHGFAANRDCIKTMLSFSYEQGILPNIVAPEEAFLLPNS
jgi:4,5-dihydroxyphthalate decarboxylase